MKHHAITPLLSLTAFAAPCLSAAELGDLSALHVIADDTLQLATAGDLAAAQLRITDFETAWDVAAPTMQPLNPDEWAYVDHAADAAIESLRATGPVQTEVEAAVHGLIAALDDPAAGVVTPASNATEAPVAFAVANADGSPLPCEIALKTLRDAQSGRTPTDQAGFDTAMSKGLERCTADDDKRADAFFAEAFALL